MCNAGATFAGSAFIIPQWIIRCIEATFSAFARVASCVRYINRTVSIVINPIRTGRVCFAIPPIACSSPSANESACGPTVEPVSGAGGRFARAKLWYIACGTRGKADDACSFKSTVGIAASASIACFVSLPHAVAALLVINGAGAAIEWTTRTGFTAGARAVSTKLCIIVAYRSCASGAAAIRALIPHRARVSIVAEVRVVGMRADSCYGVADVIGTGIVVVTCGV